MQPAAHAYNPQAPPTPCYSVAMKRCASLQAVEKAEAGGGEWFERNVPVGTSERQEANRAFEEDLAPHLSSHEGRILTVSVERAGCRP